MPLGLFFPTPPPRSIDFAPHFEFPTRGTGFDVPSYNDPFVASGGGTGWLRTLVPVEPGSEIEVRFILFDGTSNVYDSMALIKDFRFSAEIVDEPITTG